jgi:hypothetical protein
MTDQSTPAAPDVAKASSQTLSQLLARILDQLALSAWLPSAALTLLIAFTLQLGSVLDSKKPPTGPGEALTKTFAALGRTSLSGLILLLVAIVVLTMVTQAFSFESIRLLEGYWGVNCVSERLAQARARHFRKVQKNLNMRHRKLTKRAWEKSKTRLTCDNRLDRDMLTVLEAQVLKRQRQCAIVLPPDKKQIVDDFDWTATAPGDWLRRRTDLDKRLDDFPDKRHTMPTLLGNVLRRYEDETGSEAVERLVQDSFDRLPLSLQITHDQQRSRLDLYCSMHFVIAVAAAVAAIRLGPGHWTYVTASFGIATLAIWVLYRAAVASARHYGTVLVSIADVLSEDDSSYRNGEGTKAATTHP